MIYLSIKISIRIEKEDKYIEIPLKVKEIRKLYDIYLFTREKIDSIAKKLMFLIHDVIDDGTVFTYKNGKLVKLKEKHYIIRKPKWRVKHGVVRKIKTSKK